MKSRCQKGSKAVSGKGGFTLIELLAVIAIIGILAGLIGTAMTFAQKRAAFAQASADIGRLKLAIESYRVEEALYPRATNIVDLLNFLYFDRTNNNLKAFIEFGMNEVMPGQPWLDPWGSEYRFDSISATRRNRDTYDLWSTAGRAATDEANFIKNW